MTVHQPTLKQLQYLVSLHEHGHFGRAAEACFVSQSTLSAGLRDLESLLGVTGHFLHHDQFFPNQPRFWRVEFTIPLLKELGITTVHEAVYALTAPQRRDRRGPPVPPPGDDRPFPL